MTQLPEPKIQLKHDITLDIATGRSRFVDLWTNQKVKYSAILDKFTKPYVYQHKYEEYMVKSKEEQDKLKDRGGFVGGYLKDGRRRKQDVLHRQIITLDADFVDNLPELLEKIENYYCAACYYSTHKHSPDKPRLRILFILSRPVSPEEYELIARTIAFDLGIEQFDHTTYQPERLMYWPTVSKDGEYLFEKYDYPPMDPDCILNRYDDWRDMSKWPESSKETQAIRERGKQKGNPLAKEGIIGAFNNTFDIPEAIEQFLQHAYEKVTDNRYSYVEGTTSGGLLLYSHDETPNQFVYAYSYHSTDPLADGHSHNAFDMVRLHLFGELDNSAKPDTPVNRLPSYQKMVQFALDNGDVKVTLAKQQFEDVEDDGLEEEQDEEWKKKLEFDKRAGLKDTFKNYLTILQNDKKLQNRLATDDFAHRYVVLDHLPWREVGQERFWKNSDDAELRGYIETKYKVISRNKSSDAIDAIFARNRFHPVREYLNSLEWDGIERVDKLLTDYLGAEDTPFNRAVSRKTLCAATARIMQPGIKFDYMLVLIGSQGIGKSSLFSRLAGKWFSDSLTTVQNKEAYEQLQGVWVIEMGELAATRKADVESLKHFLSKQTDSFRVAYGKHVSDFPRQCIFVGTTNDREFLKDRTGNRRFWPVPVSGAGAKSIWNDLTDDEIGQIWAEALYLWKKGEKLYLSRELEEEARKVQEEHTEESPLYGMISEFLERKLSDDWDSLDVYQRRDYLREKIEGTITRDRVCSMEIWTELMGNDARRFPPFERREINEIMRRMPGWAPSNVMRFGSIYGRQRGFIRVKNVNRHR